MWQSQNSRFCIWIILNFTKFTPTSIVNVFHIQKYNAHEFILWFSHKLLNISNLLRAWKSFHSTWIIFLFSEKYLLGLLNQMFLKMLIYILFEFDEHWATSNDDHSSEYECQFHKWLFVLCFHNLYSRTVHLSIFSLICWGNRLYLCLLLLLLIKQAHKILQNRLKSSIMMYTNKIFSL